LQNSGEPADEGGESIVLSLEIAPRKRTFHHVLVATSILFLYLGQFNLINNINITAKACLALSDETAGWACPQRDHLPHTGLLNKSNSK
jgi:hypothetical protein